MTESNREAGMPAIISNSFCVTPRRPRGVALIMVLLIVLAITILSAGFLARTDAELACGQNMLLRVQMDQLADSGLEHVRGLLLHPQDVEGDYWTGATAQQLFAEGPDYYDVMVARDTSRPTDYCTYHLTCEAYRLRDAEKIGRSCLSAQLRLDPCIAQWAGANIVQRPGWLCAGDLFCAGAAVNLGSVEGDVFARAWTGSASGRFNDLNQLPLAWPRVTVQDFTTRYGTVTIAPGILANATLGPFDPPRVCYSNGDLTLAGNVRSYAMLLVRGDLVVQGSGIVLTAAKNMPALYVTGNLILRQADKPQIHGLVVVDGNVLIGADTVNGNITGGLFAAQRLVETATDASGNGNDALLCGQPVWCPTAGRSGGALQLDEDDYLQTLDSSTRLQVTTEYTLSVWLKPASVQRPWAGIICKTDPLGTATPSTHWALQFGGSGNTLYVYHSPLAWDTGLTLGDLGDGLWHHVAIVRQADGTMISYLDGGVRKTMDPSDPFKSRLPGSGPGHLNLGAERTALPDCLYTGLLDEVRIYNEALGQSDIDRLYALQNVAAAPIGHWRLNEGGSSLTVAAQPTIAAIVTWSTDGAQECWSPAAGALFRSIRRE